MPRLADVGRARLCAARLWPLGALAVVLGHEPMVGARSLRRISRSFACVASRSSAYATSRRATFSRGCASTRRGPCGMIRRRSSNASRASAGRYRCRFAAKASGNAGRERRREHADRHGVHGERISRVRRARTTTAARSEPQCPVDLPIAARRGHRALPAARARARGAAAYLRAAERCDANRRSRGAPAFRRSCQFVRCWT